MTRTESFEALRKANPRSRGSFPQSVEAVADAVRLQVATATEPPRYAHPRRGLVRVSVAGASLAIVAAVAAFLTVGSSGDGPGVESAAAAVTKAATLTAASAERSGTAVVRITHNGELWAGKTIRWHEGDVAISGDARRSGKVGSELLVVDGTLYGVDPENGGWVDMGNQASIDPDSGTTPKEHLAAVREDIGGGTLRRITGMTGLQASRLDNGTTVYGGTVAAGLIARETGFKEGQLLRVLPFGYVAHDEAADPTAGLEAAVTVGADGIVRQIAVKWGTSASAWTYQVAYSKLGATPAIAAPANARSLLRDRGLK